MAAKLSIIPRAIDGKRTYQRAKDGYFNATAMCRATDKLWGNYWRNDTTQAFLEELSSDARISISELIQSVKGGKPEFQGR